MRDFWERNRGYAKEPWFRWGPFRRIRPNNIQGRIFVVGWFAGVAALVGTAFYYKEHGMEPGKIVLIEFGLLALYSAAGRIYGGMAPPRDEE